MALRCSLLGHDYGDSIVDHEREERGSEVVVTVEEYETCSRCGKKHVISENTEVTTLAEAPADETDGTTSEDHVDTDTVASADTGGSGDDTSETVGPTPATDATTTGTDTPDPDPVDTGTIIDDTETPAETATATDDPTATQSPETDTAGEESDAVTASPSSDTDAGESVDVPVDETGDPVIDDGEILSDDGERTDRSHGEWPDSDDVGPPVDSGTEPTEWVTPESTADDSGTPDATDSFAEVSTDEEPTPANIEGTVTDSSGIEVAGDAVEDGSTGEATGPESEDAVVLDADIETVGSEETTAPVTDAGPETGLERAASVPAPGSSSPDDGPTALVCPRCEFAETGDHGSLRAGDICPACKKGYLGTRSP